MRPVALSLVLLLALGAYAGAQPTPFDMTPERGTVPPSPGTPPSIVPPRAAPVVPSEATAPPATVPSAAPQAAGAGPAPSTAEARRRYLLAMPRLTLSGETDERRWSVFLREAEAAAGGSIAIAYQSSILVAPETSRLRVLVNGQEVIGAEVAAPEAVAELRVEIPAGLLLPGYNTIAFSTSMRHRTDCTIQSTYDLWAEIDGARTFIELNEGVASPSEVADIRAVGIDALGATRHNIVLPQGQVAEAQAATIRLSQGLSLLAATPNQTFSVGEATMPVSGPGSLTTFVGPADALAAIVPNMPQPAARGPFVGFLQMPDGSSALLLSGPDWRSVEAAVEQLVGPSERALTLQRRALAQPGWRTPDAPLLFDAASIPLSELGVVTQEFSGRRFVSRFDIGVPADFYAEAYGEATLRLDAAFTSAVRPGSRIDIYVNGNIATTIPIGSTTGDVLRDYPVPVTLRHFRPGANAVVLEAILDAEADTVCLPGTAGGSETRFALFDSSRFEMPSFARISRRPDLSAFSGVGYPYNRLQTAIPFIIGEASADTLAASATLAGRIALVAGRPLDFNTRVAAAAAAGFDAIFVAPAARIPSGIPTQVGLVDTIRSGWSAAGPNEVPDDTNTSIARWRENVGSAWRRPFEQFQEWLRQRFDLSADALRLARSPEPPFAPTGEMSLVVAQGLDPSQTHTWTVVTARNAGELAAGVAELANEPNWNSLWGRITTFDPADGSYTQLPSVDSRLVPSVPASFTNLRLVAANWLSDRALGYALLLALVSIVLGAATSALVSKRRGH